MQPNLLIDRCNLSADLYPYISPGVEFKQISNEDFIIFFGKGKTEKLTKAGWIVYEQCNGIKTIAKQFEELQTEYEIDIEDYMSFLLNAYEKNILLFSEKPKHVNINFLQYTGIDFPPVASIILTDKCNLKCIYCYGNYGPLEKELMSFSDVEKLFKILNKNGTRLIELTGGEPLFHPDFQEILKLAIAKFHYLTILSNGVLFNNEMIDTIIKNKKKIGVQISIDGSDDATNDIVRGCSNTWQRTLDNINKLTKGGVKLRIGYVIIPENINDTENVVNLMRKAGVTDIAFSLAEGIGRGSNLKHPDRHAISNYDSPHFKHINDILNKVTEKNEDIIFTQSKALRLSPKYHEKTNCGTGWERINILPNGDILTCQMLGKDGHIIGNIFTDNLKELFNVQNDSYRLYRTFCKSADDKECNLCTYKHYCGNCIMKIYLANKEMQKTGKEFCHIVLNHKMEKIFDFNKQITYNI